MKCNWRVCCVAGILLVTWQSGFAQGLSFTGSGFLTVAAGKVLGGTSDPSTDAGYRCPCFIADYSQGGVYDDGSWQAGPESKLGLQGTVSTEDRRYSVTGQVVSRGSRGGAGNLEWLYATAEVTADTTVQVGRKRLPLFAYSEVQDVGYAFPWVHLAPQLYGWEVLNYNGASLTWRSRLGDASTLVHVFGGEEQLDDAPYWKVYNGRDSRTDSLWTQIAGIEGKLNWDTLEMRGVYITSNTQNRDVTGGVTTFSDPLRQQIWGLSAKYEPGAWFLQSELLYIDRRQDYGVDRSASFAAGRHFGPWLVMVSWAGYRQQAFDPTATFEGHDLRSLSLRYELGTQSAIKLQLDDWKDFSSVDYAQPHGDRRMVSLAYVRIF